MGRTAGGPARTHRSVPRPRCRDRCGRPVRRGVRGLINIQMALAGDGLYVLEANPWASRTLPFVSKTTGIPLAKAAARIAAGVSIAELRSEGLLPKQRDGGSTPLHGPVAVKESVLPWNRFRDPEGEGSIRASGPRCGPPAR
ncbi:hypothetical protein [Micromonospora sp. NPDC049102]|uniref:ATP-binding protein n=1 Tax=Micromonospora sp. NPDC049102 TaxID=3364265 RepID=UPI003718E23F